MAENGVGVGVIGTGGVAHLHTRALQAIPGARPVGAYSRNPNNVATFADEFGIRGYRALDELLEDASVEVVAVATPAPHHVDHAEAALAAGKHVVVEKPVSRAVEEIAGLRAAARRADRVCMPCHNYIYSPTIRRSRQILDDGKLGKLASLWVLYNQAHAPEHGGPGDTLHGLCVHHAYIALFLGGRPVRVSAVGTNVHFTDKSAHDQIMIVCELEAGAIANLWGSFAVDDRTSRPWSMYYKILGSDGGICYSWDDVRFGSAPLPGWDMAAYRDSFMYLYQYFLTECLEKGRPPLSTLDDAIDALCVLQASERSIAHRTGTVEVEYGS